MKRFIALSSLALAIALSTAGCMSSIRKEVDQSIAEARQDLHRDPITLHAEGKPDAAISPQGIFEIDGKPFAANPGQAQAVQAYRNAMISYGDAGLDVAAKEAGPLASRAVRHALFGVLTGRQKQEERHIDEDSARLEAKVRALCPQVVDAKSAQDALARILPEFGPYAKLTSKDIEPCQGGNAPRAAAVGSTH